jgi:hypothetical protein
MRQKWSEFDSEGFGMNEWHTNILATHEEPQDLATGPWKGDAFPGVALPSSMALKRWVIIKYGSVWTCAWVADIGPWCIDDDIYVCGGERPRAEVYINEPCPLTLLNPEQRATLTDGTVCEKSNGAGIDLFPFTAKLLGINPGENVRVDWMFVTLNQ